jgi:hypothetical protein
MKRETSPRYLHMGCGEGLVARVPLAPSKTTKLPDEQAVKPAKPRTGEGRR